MYLIIRLNSKEITNACSAFNTSGKAEDNSSKVTKMGGKCGKYDESIFSGEFLCLVVFLLGDFLRVLLSVIISPHSRSQMFLSE